MGPKTGKKSKEDLLRIINSLKKDQLIEVIHWNVDYTHEEEPTAIDITTKESGYFKRYEPLNPSGEFRDIVFI